MWKIWIPAYKLIAKVAPDNILVTRPIIASIVCILIFTLTLPIYALALIVPSKLENFTSGFVKGALELKIMAYSKEVVDRFEGVLNSPKQFSVGRFDLKDPTVATGMTGAPACGDVMKLQLRIDPGNNRIMGVKFKTWMWKCDCIFFHVC